MFGSHPFGRLRLINCTQFLPPSGKNCVQQALFRQLIAALSASVRMGCCCGMTAEGWVECEDMGPADQISVQG